MDQFHRNTGQQGWVLEWMHLRISTKGSPSSFYARAGFCSKDPVKTSLFRVIIFFFSWKLDCFWRCLCWPQLGRLLGKCLPLPILWTKHG